MYNRIFLDRNANPHWFSPITLSLSPQTPEGPFIPLTLDFPLGEHFCRFFSQTAIFPPLIFGNFQKYVFFLTKSEKKSPLFLLCVKTCLLCQTKRERYFWFIIKKFAFIPRQLHLFGQIYIYGLDKYFTVNKYFSNGMAAVSGASIFLVILNY